MFFGGIIIMAWYDEAVFYHIYPLGLTGAPKQNAYEKPVHRLNTLLPWITHIHNLGCNALYIGPLFESVGHGYETTDYKKLDSRLGTNEDLTDFVKECHRQGIRVILDGVFNHTGRDFFAFKDIQKNRESSRYRDWYCNVNFWGNNEYNDGFSYENWGGYNLLVKLNQRNPEVKDYICDVIRFWVKEFDIDGIRLDAADVLDFDFMKALRQTANEVKPEFWLMGEVIHGDYIRWVNERTLHSVTNYHLHKALYSGHNDHNYFEIAHTVKRLYEMGGNRPDGLKLYNFVDNHDVERIYTKLSNKAHFAPVHILMYTLPGIPSIYYGSEFGIEGKKEYGSDDSLRPQLNLEDYKDAITSNPCTALIAALGKVRAAVPALSYGDYQQRVLTNRQYAFTRSWNGCTVAVTVNNDDNEADFWIPIDSSETYVGALAGAKVQPENGQIHVNVKGNFGEIWVPESALNGEQVTVSVETTVSKEETMKDTAGKVKTTAADNIDLATNAVKESTEMADPNEVKRTTPSLENTITGPADNADATPVTSAAEILSEIPDEAADSVKPESSSNPEIKAEKVLDLNKPYEEMSVEELQAAILEKLAKNGPVTDQMRRDVAENIYPNSLLNWIKSFR